MIIEEVLDYSNLSDSEFVDQNGFLSAERAFVVLERLAELEKFQEQLRDLLCEKPEEFNVDSEVECWVDSLEELINQ